MAKPTVSEVSKDTTSSILNAFKIDESMDEPTGNSNAEILGSIYKLMLKNEQLKKLRYAKDLKKIQNSNTENEKRHQEIVEALGVKTKIPEKEVEKLKPIKLKKPKTPAKPAISVKPRVEPVGKPTITRPTPSVPTPSTPKPSPGVSTATKIGMGAAGVGLAAAAISIFGETGAKNKSQAIAKGGQIAKNDPEPGHSSYGIFGMNSKAKTIHAFAKSYPEFGLTASPATEEFDKQWASVAQSRPEELYNAQLDWYDKNVLKPLRKDLSNLQLEYANDNRILAYMADRRIQYGSVMEKQALKYASSGSNASEFIDRMTDFDLENLGTAFKTALGTNPRIELGLRNRIQRRKAMAMQVENTVGDNLDNTSKSNQELHEQNKQQDSALSVNKTNNINVQQNKEQSFTKEDDRSAYERKKNSK